MSKHLWRVVVDKWPTPDGEPFVDQELEFWERVYDEYLRSCAGVKDADYPDWMPDEIPTYINVDNDKHWHGPQFTRTLQEPDEPEVGYFTIPFMAVPVAGWRRFFSKSSPAAMCKQLREWGCAAHIERAAIGEWETLPA